MAARRLPGNRLIKIWRRAREPAFVLNRFGRLLDANGALEELTGRALESIRGLRCRPRAKFADPALAELAQCLRPPRAAWAGQPARSEAIFTRTTGEQTARTLDFWPWHDGDGTTLGVLGLARLAEDSPSLDAQAESLRAELAATRDALLARRAPPALIGSGPAADRLLAQVRLAAATPTPVLIVGEPGTGRRSVAQAIHRLGPEPQRPLWPFDVEALPAEVLARELLDGHRFRPPRGTLLLGDVAHLPRDVQARLAPIWDETAPLKLIATTRGDLDQARADDALRDDFYHRLTPLVIRLAPLRGRRDEVPLLAQHFLERGAERGGRAPRGFAADALRILQDYDWPGNLQELARVVESARRHGAAALIEAADLPRAIQGDLGAADLPPPTPIVPLDDRLAQAERRWIQEALDRAGGNKSRAAELLGISRPRLIRRVQEFGIGGVAP